MSKDLSNNTVARRDFLKTAWAGLAGLVGMQFGGMTLAYMQPRQALGAAGGWITAGAVDDFPPGSVTHILNARAYLARLPDGGFLALHQRCTHLGCNVPWDQSQNAFVCPCHNSQFNTAGEVLNPPAPRALDVFALQIEDGQVRIDASAPIARDRFAPEQVTYA